MREALEGRPESQRTRLLYERVLDAYRGIYHGDPGSPRADAAVAAVADLLAEEGRVFEDEKALRDAIGQYEFLRRQYPGSRYRFGALLTEAEIYQRDLGEPVQAKAAYESFIRLYPQNPLRVEAETELKSIRRAELGNGRAQASRGSGTQRKTVLSAATQSKQAVPQPTPLRRSAAAGGTPGLYARTQPATSGPGIEEGSIPPQGSDSGPEVVPSPQMGVNASTTSITSDAQRMNAPPPPPRGKLPLVTGIRHWSTPDYTRVAIDMQQEVRYQAARVSNPDRIFFDLYGARLSPELQGRAVEVTDDGFLTRIRAAQSNSNTTRIVLDVNSVSDYSAFFLQNPSRLIIDVHGSRGGIPMRQIAGNPPSSSPAPGSYPGRSTNSVRRAAPPNPDNGSAIADVATLGSQPNEVRAKRRPTTAPVAASVPGTMAAAQTNPPRSAYQTRTAPARATDDAPPAEAGATGIPAAEPAPSGQHVPNSMVRALGLKINRIVIDAGHGGHDSGTLGPGGLEEKDVVLDVALRLGRLLKQRLGADVIYTRGDDTFIPLETRTAIANQAQADLFISIHANSSQDPTARGVEVYYLNFTSSADALEVAARENAVSDESIHQLSDLVKKIALQDKINESREFASEVDQSLYAGLGAGNPGLRDRGVKKAPFVVLIGANMPSILAEISFLTNPDDAAELRDTRYRERIAESLYRGVARYVSSLNGVRVAQAPSHPASTE